MRTLLCILTLFLCVTDYAQELPPMEKFTPLDYGGGNQNWMIAQTVDRYIYVANNIGLLEYNGAVWNTYSSPNKSIIRAVKVIGNKIYTGCYSEFGYWQKNELGSLEYTSLIPKLKDFTFQDDQIWNILEYDDWILFQSGYDLLFYNQNTEDFKIISSKNIIYKIFKVHGQIYYHVANEGLYKLEDGTSKLIADSPLILNDRVIDIFENNEGLTIITRNSGFYHLHNGDWVRWDIPSNPILSTLNIFSSVRLKNGNFVLGTISNGLLLLNNNGEIAFSIDQKKGLGNNTVLSLFEDEDNNVWVGLDNGINCINVDAPIKTYIDYDGILGTVYTTKVYKDFLYVGTNQGLFYRSVKAPNQAFKFVSGTAGQVWSLYNDNDQYLICGHHLGTFLIEGATSTRISSVLGAWDFKKIPDRDNLILQGNYNGLYLLEKSNGKWQEKNKIAGFNHSSRFIEVTKANQVWVNHEYKGVFRVQLDTTLTKAIDVKQHSELTHLKNSSLVTYQQTILFASESNFFKYNPKNEKFEPDPALNSLYAATAYTSGKMVVDQSGKLWTFSQDNISYLDNNDLTSQLEVIHFSIPSYLRRGVTGFENIEALGPDQYILGTSGGYLSVDLSKKDTEQDYTIHLHAITLRDLNGNLTRLPLRQAGEFEHKQGILTFAYAVPEYDKFKDVNFQYKLTNHTDRWSTWSKQSSVQFENLGFGEYTFEVAAKVGNQLTNNTETYSFEINRPWYISNPALLFYGLCLVCIGYLIHKAYKFYYERILKHKQIQNEKAIIQIQNEKLNQEIENKNNELAISTMSIIRKNELLGRIKKELKHNNIESTIRLIDNNLSNNNDWELFKEAFNNADKGFLDKIKEKHPNLTPNDLRFCAYLRLNLTSKEMAPLLNISIKSVETKRYRLRKKLNLNHDDGLVDYILNI